ncbi:SRPBCC family protein [Pseudoflavitalea sp. G-6-1-2]|uniref:SRPBCC family protein n=1 Tax=Pseudoflavitalea sp. G-6-1-2 TaxID=2728841 RepID=UPI00146A8010|nr:SRPBCC family protein [Pseudoflavitalea sp. G-6-1-2]NML20039.1 SRPBCC family protein [Pseudoflavitalea sp. G-6-1-2]
MPTIHLTTFIAAPVERVFDLSRSIELHRKSMSHTGEEAVAGTTSGLLDLNDTVTWKAKHLMKTRYMKVTISAMSRPLTFTDEMVKGDLRSMKHEHHFKQIDNGTLMIDVFQFESPYGFIGSALNKLFLSKYFAKLLAQRNEFLRQCAETDKWKFVLMNSNV